VCPDCKARIGNPSKVIKALLKRHNGNLQAALAEIGYKPEQKPEEDKVEEEEVEAEVSTEA
jgi:hypothetical protein